MAMLTAGLLLFFGVHLFTSARGARGNLIGTLGEPAYKGLYALASLAGLVLIAWGKARAAFIPLYEPSALGRSLALSLMPVAFMLLAASHMPTNLKRVTAHPMLWGVTLWSALHLLANGDGASVALFGAFFLYSLYAMTSQTRRGARPRGTAVPVMKDVIVVVAGLVVSIALAAAHGLLFGMPLSR